MSVSQDPTSPVEARENPESKMGPVWQLHPNRTGQ